VLARPLGHCFQTRTTRALAGGISWTSAECHKLLDVDQGLDTGDHAVLLLAQLQRLLPKQGFPLGELLRILWRIGLAPEAMRSWRLALLDV
jgi:hypothetical protein